MKFRKLFALASSLVVGLSLVACKKEEEKEEEVVEVVKATNIGLGYNASYADGTATVTGALVSFDKDGKILDTRIDVVQVKIEKTTEATGVIALKSALNEDGYVSTKLELGKNYGMLASYGSQLAEVDNQIEAYADWTVGKTAETVATSLTARSDGHYEGEVYASDDALWAKCTITCNGFASAVKDAWDHKYAADFDGSAVAGISLVSNISEASHGAGYDQVTVDMGGTFVKDGKVVAALVDAITFSFEADGDSFKENQTTKYYDQTTHAALSKKVLGDAYAMADKNHPTFSNGCTLEWYEQAANIEAYAVGKTAEQIKATTEITGATITITAYTKALSNAAKYAVLEHVGPQH